MRDVLLTGGEGAITLCRHARGSVSARACTVPSGARTHPASSPRAGTGPCHLPEASGTDQPLSLSGHPFFLLSCIVSIRVQTCYYLLLPG